MIVYRRQRSIANRVKGNGNPHKPESIPEKISKKFCQKCSYYEYCWSGRSSSS
ncbi:MAG: Dna2/Cas4 domain-containing protein [Opitutaceae bacterium]|nr:Dna2/Cas4 domain-containing protein [Cytophagales bacterium]